MQAGALLEKEQEKEEEDSTSGRDDEDLADFQGAQDQAATGPYATLHSDGPKCSGGSDGHPDACMPCTFYCFTRRGCNRGLECRFCHLAHQSKLQQRREAWKKQQREKRKAIRERMATEVAPPRKHPPGSRLGLAAGMDNGSSQAMPGDAAVGGQPCASEQLSEAMAYRAAMPESLLAASVFAYNPSQAVLTIGQDAEFRPHLAGGALRFRLVAPLPPGMNLDPLSGMIYGAPQVPQPQVTLVVEADLLNGSTARGTLDLEVVDFTRGGFVIGHMSEFEPGKFMLLLYIPEDGDTADGTGAVARRPMMPMTGPVSAPPKPAQQLQPRRISDACMAPGPRRPAARQKNGYQFAGFEGGLDLPRAAMVSHEHQAPAKPLDWW